MALERVKARPGFTKRRILSDRPGGNCCSGWTSCTGHNRKKQRRNHWHQHAGAPCRSGEDNAKAQSKQTGYRKRNKVTSSDNRRQKSDKFTNLINPLFLNPGHRCIFDSIKNRVFKHSLRKALDNLGLSRKKSTAGCETALQKV